MHAALVEKATTNLSAWMEHVPGEAAAATHAEEIGARLRRSDGVVLRVWECSATLSGLRTPEQFARCVLDELRSTQLRAASLLRWDVPFALYGGGRMRQASPSVAAAHPRSAGELCGCSGRRASTMLGWVLRRAGRADIRTSHTGWARVRAARATNRQRSAFAHDAALWTEAGATMGPPCISGRNSTAEEYARARLDVVERDSPMAPLHSACHRHTDWSAMLQDVRAYVVAAEASPLGRAAPDCGFGVRSLYNQVHIAWSLEDISAIFYVNDTVTAAHAPAEGAEERAYLLAEARAAAARSYRAALMARLASLPIVQFVVRDECFNLARAKARVLGQLRHGDTMIRPPPGWSAQEVADQAAAHFPLRKEAVKCGTPFTCGCNGNPDPIVHANTCEEPLPRKLSECYDEIPLVLGEGWAPSARWLVG